MSTHSDLRSLAHCKEQAEELFSIIHDEERARIRRWEDEKPAISVSVSAMGPVRSGGPAWGDPVTLVSHRHSGHRGL